LGAFLLCLALRRSGFTPSCGSRAVGVRATDPARGMVKLITFYLLGIAALAIVGGLFVAVCIESLIAPKDDPS
jgi:hypothetical protein